MGCIGSTPYFCMTTKTVKYLEKPYMDNHYEMQAHPLEVEAENRVTDDSGEPKPKADSQWL